MTPEAERSWSTFGEETLSRKHNDGPDGYFAFRAADCSLRWIPQADHHAWLRGVIVHENAELRGFAKHALVHNLSRVLRWGGGSKCSVLSHSIRVGIVASEISLRLGGSAAEQRACLRLGAIHDLHEALPGIGDVPSPALRWMRATMPEIDALHAGAEDLVLRVCEADVELEDIGRARVIVKWSDRMAASAMERAAYFDDAPEWLGYSRCLAIAAKDEAHEIRECDAQADTSDLADMLDGGAVLARTIGVMRRLMRTITDEDLARMIF